MEAPKARVAPSTMPPTPPHRDLMGKTIGGKYLVRSVLGEGGMGAVFEAENLALGRSVAVKVLHPAQAREEGRGQTLPSGGAARRARSAIRTSARSTTSGRSTTGSPYLVMERLVGETLADRIASEGGLPFDDVIDILTQVLSGLVAAHEKGIVHRDIKPENVFLTKRVGCPALAKLLDFGVSKMIGPVLGGEREEDLDLTRTGMVMGTPFYMSPEQARGDRNLDARVDLYACGIMLYEALTGRRPFTAANYNALLLQILTTKPRPARELRPALPLGFDEVLDKALARNRDDRFQSAAEFQRELQALRDRHPKTAVGMERVGHGAAGLAASARDAAHAVHADGAEPAASGNRAGRPARCRRVARSRACAVRSPRAGAPARSVAAAGLAALEPTPSSVEIPNPLLGHAAVGRADVPDARHRAVNRRDVGGGRARLANRGRVRARREALEERHRHDRAADQSRDPRDGQATARRQDVVERRRRASAGRARHDPNLRGAVQRPPQAPRVNVPRTGATIEKRPAELDARAIDEADDANATLVQGSHR